MKVWKGSDKRFKDVVLLINALGVKKLISTTDNDKGTVAEIILIDMDTTSEIFFGFPEIPDNRLMIHPGTQMFLEVNNVAGNRLVIITRNIMKNYEERDNQRSDRPKHGTLHHSKGIIKL